MVSSMDRLAPDRDDDLRALVQGLTRKGVREEFVKKAWGSPAGASPWLTSCSL